MLVASRAGGARGGRAQQQILVVARQLVLVLVVLVRVLVGVRVLVIRGVDAHNVLGRVAGKRWPAGVDRSADRPRRRHERAAAGRQRAPRGGARRRRGVCVGQGAAYRHMNLYCWCRMVTH